MICLPYQIELTFHLIMGRPNNHGLCCSFESEICTIVVTVVINMYHSYSHFSVLHFTLKTRCVLQV